MPLTVEEQAKVIVSRLGAFDARGIAWYLEREAVHGKRANLGECVLVDFLLRHTTAEFVQVRHRQTVVNRVVIENPESVRKFLWLYDAGAFPRLETDNFLRSCRFDDHGMRSDEVPPTALTVAKMMRQLIVPWSLEEPRKEAEHEEVMLSHAGV
jgi:hypothetical protein